MPDDSYKRMLDRADTWFAKVMREQPRNLQCGRGCSLCCHGLFEIGSGDIPLLAAGLATPHSARRKAVIRRALGIVETPWHPHPRGCSGAEKELCFGGTSQTAGPELHD